MAHGRSELIKTWKILPTGLNVQFWSRYSKQIHPGAYRGRITLSIFGQILISQENTHSPEIREDSSEIIFFSIK